MASTLSKRQQARNERALQDLIKNVPGNNTCADCGARNPGWASWSLGIFLCMRCAALHRKLGTHISKVKSLSMDKWDSAQVDNMKRIGNTDSNKTYNPRNIQPQIPIDVDEVDGAMERYIRQKYEQRIYLQDSRPGTRQNTGSTSSEDRPPPLPPKPTGRFGFGLRKAITSPKNLTPPVSPGLGGFGQETSPPRVNKASRVFGSSVSTSGDGLESKLTTLREMGFADDKRNSTVLKGLNGNLDRTVEALIRLGEQAPGKSTAPPPPAKPSSNGLTLERAKTEPAPPVSSNPFDALDAAPLPVSQQQQQLMGTNGASMQAAPAQNSYNPFLSQMSQSQYQQPSFQSQQQPQQQQQPSFYDQNPFGQQQQQPSLEQSFQNMQVSYQQQQQQQPLFPNRTGGYGQPSRPAQTNPFLQSFTPPPMPQIPEQYSSFFAPQPQYQSMSNPSSPGGNPFLKTSRSQIFTPSNATPFGQADTQQQFQQQQSSNPWAQQQQPQQQPQQPTQTTSPSLASNPWQQQAYQQTGMQQSTTATPQPSFQQQNYLQTGMQQPSTTASQPSFQQQTFQQTGLQQPSTTTPQPNFQQQSFSGHPNPFDKSSILNLYNQPQQQQQTQQAPMASIGNTATPTSMAGNANMNPFASSISPQPVQQSSMAVAQQQAQGTRHVSNESVDFAGLMGGRHSPDAFSGLSASFRR